jgi:putative transcriptional regulator
MMKVRHGQILDDASRAALASGRAEPALALLVDSLMEMRGISERDGEIISGAALETETPVEMSPHALDMVFAAIERGGQKAGAQKSRTMQPLAALAYAELGVLPAMLRSAIRDAEEKRSWSYAGPGVRTLPLGLPGDAKAEIIRLEPGAAVPWHTHKGQELTLCLIGEFSDSRGVYGPGDCSISDPTIRHQPLAHKAGPVYALAVTDAGLKFEGLLGAIQKLFGA